MSDNHQIEQWDDRIEAYVDGQLPQTEVVKLEALLDQDALLSAEVSMANRIRSEFRSMPSIACPEAVSREIHRAIRRDIRKRAIKRWIERTEIMLSGYRKFALAGLIVIAVMFVLRDNVATNNGESAPIASVEQALDDVKWTLALLSDAGSNAAGTVRSDVVEPLLIDRLGSTLDVLTETQN
ncbi:MAG: hypothetical protein E2O84_00760 [Bacteroidetes bacterium]|nr:MAG: hypothetical protein E2O84_00760 [Bacteroidota bacterium]